MAGEASSGTFLQGLERGLAVIRAFSADAPALTLSEVARDVGLTPATARRILLTLEQLGYVRTDGRQFSLTPRVLALGWAYLSSLDLGELAGPYMEELSAATRESCSIATLDLPDIVYVARVPTSRIMTVALGVGARLPAYPTSMGRVLLAGLGAAALDAYLSDVAAEQLTPHTITSPDQLRAAIDQTRTDGYALVDQELELGLRSLAAPIHNSRGRIIAALN
ncbi:IclR family transcriptional regulator domain-containing protein, partial [Kribbella albertanoniae]